MLHRDPDATLSRNLLGPLIAGVDVPDYPHARIVGQYTDQFLRGQFGAIGKRHLAGVDGTADAYPAAMVDGHPRGSRQC